MSSIRPLQGRDQWSDLIVGFYPTLLNVSHSGTDEYNDPIVGLHPTLLNTSLSGTIDTNGTDLIQQLFSYRLFDEEQVQLHPAG